MTVRAPAATRAIRTQSSEPTIQTPSAAKRNFQPRLRVEASRWDPIGGSHLTIDVTQRATERKLSRISVVIPAGYGLDPPAAGRRVAEASISLVAPGKLAQLPPLVLEGDLRSGKRVGGSCASGPVWVMRGTIASEGGLESIRQPLAVFVHRSGGARRIEICLPTKPLPGKRTIRRLVLRIFSGLVPPGPGDAVWRGIFRPVAANAAAARSMTTESRGIVPLPSFLTLEPVGKPRAAPGSRITLKGTLSLNGPSDGRTVQVSVAVDQRGFRPAGRVRSGANGGFTFRTKVPRRAGPVFFQARAASKPVPCRAGKSLEAPAGCTSATLSGITGPSVRITVVKS